MSEDACDFCEKAVKSTMSKMEKKMATAGLYTFHR